MQALHIHLNQQPTPMLGQGANVHGMNASIRDDYSFDSFLQREVNEQKLKATDGPPENRSSASDPPSAQRSEHVADKSQTEQESRPEKTTQTNESSQTATVEHSKDAEKEVKAKEKNAPFAALGELDNKLAKDGVLDGKLTKDSEIAKDDVLAKDSKIAKDGVLDGKLAKDDVLAKNSEIAKDDALAKDSELVKDDVLDSELSNADFLKVHSDAVVVNVPSDGVVPVEILEDAKNTPLSNDNALADEQADSDTVSTDDVILTALGAGSLNGAEQLASKNSLVKNDDANTGSKTDALDANKKSKQVLAEIPTISVQDERTVTAEGKADGKFVNSVNYDGHGNATMDLSLTPNGANLQNTAGAIINADGSVQQHTTTNAQQFGTMLSAEIQSNSSELVKTGSIVLRDGNQGTINLILHPEELGNVKIRLEISDNILTGRIIVASEEAYNAFKENLASLREAFLADGFETAGFDLSWSGNENNQTEEEQDGQGKNPFGNRYDDNIAIIPEGAEAESDYTLYGSRAYINVMA